MTSDWARRRVSAVVSVRNDNYGGNLKQRAELTLRAQAYVFDEVVVVDFNSAALTNRSTAVVKSPLIDTLELEVATRANIVSVIINASACAVLMGRPCGQNFYETAARNVGVRAATGDFVVSTNIDDLPPHRELLQGLMARMSPNDALLLPRLEISLQHGAALFRREGGGGVDEALRMLQVRPADYHAAARSGCGSGGTSAWGFERPGWRTCMSLTHLRGLFTESGSYEPLSGVSGGSAPKEESSALFGLADGTRWLPRRLSDGVAVIVVAHQLRRQISPPRLRRPYTDSTLA